MAFAAVHSFSRLSIFANCRTAIRSKCVKRPVFRLTQDTCSARPFTRSLWFLCKNRDAAWDPINNSVRVGLSKTCSCGCHAAGLHSKGDKELVEFLEEEIKNEIKVQKTPKLPNVEGFEIKTKDAEIEFTKHFNDEKITVKANVNHSVDAEDGGEPAQEQGKQTEMAEMKSKPNFTIEIEKGGKILALNCCFTSSEDSFPDDETQDSYNDSFQISELVIYNNEWKDSTYSVAGDIMDGYLYDLLMNMLEDRGIGNEFADALEKYCTSYEHKLYIGLLNNLKGFFTGK